MIKKGYVHKCNPKIILIRDTFSLEICKNAPFFKEAC